MKQNALLEVKNLHVSAEDETEILHGVNLTLGRDETHVLMGPNGPTIPSPKGKSFLTARISPTCPSTSAPRRAFSCPSRTRWRFPA